MCRGTLQEDVSTAPLQPPSGFERRRRMIEIGLLLMSVCYGAVYQLNPNVEVNPALCTDEQNSSEEGCRRPDLVAYKVTSFLSMLTMGLMGVYHWHMSRSVQKMATATPEDRLFGQLDASDYQNVVSICYQTWDFVVSLTIPEHVSPIFLTHHLLALLTAYCSLEYQMVGYYSVFFGGCSEFSSIFLVFLDQDPLLIPKPGSLFDQWVVACQGLFFLTFTYYRIIGWMTYSVPLWKDCAAVTKSGSVEKHRPGKAYFLRVFQGMDLILGALQCYWYYEILSLVAQLAS